MRRFLVVTAAVGMALLILGLLQDGSSQAQTQTDVPQATPQETPSAPPARATALETKAFGLRHKKVDEVYFLISPYLSPRGSVRMQPAQRTLTIQDAPDRLERITALIQGFDLPPRSVEVSIQLILASAGASSQAPSPPPIRGVIDKLSALSTRWTDYKMVGNARVLGTEGERSSLKLGTDYRVDFRIDQVSDDARVIRFKPFELQHREAVVEGGERYTSIMNTVLNLRDSQQFIVGASKVEQSNRALFMTVTASLQRP